MWAGRAAPSLLIKDKLGRDCEAVARQYSGEAMAAMVKEAATAEYVRTHGRAPGEETPAQAQS